MALSQEDKDFILGAKKPFLEKNITEWLFRGLVTILLFFGNDIRIQQNETSKDVTEMKIERTFYQKEMQKITTILEKPSFTKEDNSVSLSPVILQVNKNSDNIADLLEVSRNNEKRVTKIEYDLQDYLKKK